MKKVKFNKPANVILTVIWSVLISAVVLSMVALLDDEFVWKDKIESVETKDFKSDEAKAQYKLNRESMLVQQGELMVKNFSHHNNSAEVTFVKNVKHFDSTQEDLYEIKVVKRAVAKNFGKNFTVVSVIFGILSVLAISISLSTEMRVYECEFSRKRRENKENAILLEEEIIAKHRKMVQSDGYNPLELSLKSK